MLRPSQEPHRWPGGPGSRDKRRAGEVVKRGPSDALKNDDDGDDGAGGEGDDSDDRSRVGEERTAHLEPGIVCE